MPLDIHSRPIAYARLAGAIYLFVIVAGAFSEGVVMNTVTVPGDDAGTVRAILAHSSLWTWGLAANLVIPLVAVVQLWIEYRLLRPAGPGLALLFLLLNLASLAVEAVSKMFQLMVVPLAGSDSAVSEAMATFALTAHSVAFNIALIFFGAACLVDGSLIWRSGYLPRLLGALMQIAGICYLVASFAELLAPSFARMISPAILLPVLVGEASLCLWLLIRGVDAQKWRERHARVAHGQSRTL